MNWYQELGFRGKLTIPLVVLVVLVLVVGAFSISGSKKLGGYANTLAKNNLQEIQLMIQADRDLYQALVAERSLIYVKGSDTSALVKEYEENALQARDRVLQSFEISATSTADERDEYLNRFAQWKKVSDKVMELARTGNESDLESARNLSYGEADKAFVHLRNYIDELQESRLVYVAHFSRHIEEDQEAINLRSIVLVIVAALVALVAAYRLPLVVTGPLNEVSHRIQNIADGDGDLTIRLDASRKDELGKLAGNVNRFMDKLQSLIRNILNNSNQVASAAEAMMTVSTNSQRAAESQSLAISMVVSAVNELTVAIQEVARNTSNTAQNTREVSDVTDKVQGGIHQAVDRVHQLSHRISESANVMLHLEEQAKEVTSVIDVIRGVAEQTNLLALNAAIEAARAGEQGRGFAVVADEVRSLASRTQQSTQDIHTILSQLQQGVQSAVNAMEVSSKMTQDAAESAQEAGNSLSSVGSGVKSISDMTIQIATAAEEQSSVTAEIDRNLVQLNDLALDTAKDATSTAEYCKNLNVLSLEMKELLSRFKI
jgi:methyl-accepting chemotaxis protein